MSVQLIRRHRLIESFLVRMLNFDWGEIHDEADRLEHAISERMLDRIDEALGRPERDPHGDPIPAADGSFVQPNPPNAWWIVRRASKYGWSASWINRVSF